MLALDGKIDYLKITSGASTDGKAEENEKMPVSAIHAQLRKAGALNHGIKKIKK